MLAIVARNRFSREYALMVKRGKDGNKLKAVITLLANGATLPFEYKDHSLKGNFKGCRDCHIGCSFIGVILRRFTWNGPALIPTFSSSDPIAFEHGCGASQGAPAFSRGFCRYRRRDLRKVA